MSLTVAEEKPISVPSEPPSLIDAPDTPAPAAEDQKAIPAAAEESAEKEEASESAESPEKQEARNQSKFQRRLQRQRDARVAAETELRLAREENARLKAEAAPKPESGEPKREQFEDYEAYLRAVTRFDAAQEADKRLNADRDERQGRERQQTERAGQEEVAKSWKEREKTFTDVTKDYIDTVTPFLEEEIGSLSNGARQAIVELGPQLLYHLAKNPDEVERISDLSPLRQVAELGKLEASLPEVTAVKASSAPPPLKTPRGNGSAQKTYNENMSPSEYKEWRKTQGARWAKH
jgi:hypothetical protein